MSVDMNNLRLLKKDDDVEVLILIRDEGLHVQSGQQEGIVLKSLSPSYRRGPCGLYHRLFSTL
jgi:hypothetical protein